MVRGARQPMKAAVLAAAALLLALLPSEQSVASALKSDAGRKLAVVTSETPHQVQPAESGDAVTPAHDAAHEHGEGADDEDATVVRCRFCGAAVALKRDYIGLHDTSKAVASKRESVLGPNGELHTFVNPSRVEMELAGFRKTTAVESELYTKKASFFEPYNWRDVRCSSCKRHLGWKFHHDELQQCINGKTVAAIAAVSAKAQQQQRAAGAASEKERRAEIVARAFRRDACVLANSGWWSYEVCYGREVRQYHEEPDGSRPSDWSMGVFVAPEQAADTPELGSDVVQYFAGGQHCDENGQQRRTKVVYTCCKSKPASVAIDSVDEPTLCSYIINVCVPELCAKDDGAGDLDSALETRRHTEACEDELEAARAATAAPEVQAGAKAAPPLSFTALRWSTVISEDSSELDWARSMQYKM